MAEFEDDLSEEDWEDAASGSGNPASGDGTAQSARNSARSGAGSTGTAGNTSGSGSRAGSGYQPPESAYRGSYEDDKELQAIFERTFGPVKRDRVSSYKKVVSALSYSGSSSSAKKDQEEYLLVDGYNIIFAWEELRELSKVTIDGARQKLMDILCNYQGYKKCTLILVFDAYKVTGNTGEASITTISM